MKYLPLFPTSKRPLVFAHRGASSLAPENTLTSFLLARKFGAPGIELDIHLCASGELVVIHDDDVKRTAGVDGNVAEKTLSYLKSLDVGSWKGREFAGERIPTLRETFEALGDSVYYDIEIKSRSKERSGLERQLSELIDEFSLAGRVSVSCFNPFPLIYFKEVRRDVPTAIIWCRSKELPWILRSGVGAYLSKCDYLKPDHADLRGISVLSLGAKLRRPVVTWTVDDPKTAEDLIRRGCSGIVTNRIQDMGALL
jgi:glycerophosphoryl diester phosphodiesterase